MARIVTDAKLESPTARAKLRISYDPRWRAIDPGLHIGYRRGKNGGKWLSRWYCGKGKYHSEIIGVADDRQPADGVTALSFAQAQKKIRENYAKEMAPASPTGPITVREACKQYVEYLKAEKKTGADAEQRLAKHVSPQLGDRAIAALTTEEVEAFKRAMVKRDPTNPEVERRSRDTANRTLTSLKAALNRVFADPKNHIPNDAAWRRVAPFKGVSRSREIFLDAIQTKRLVNVTKDAFRRLVTAALLTGARPPHELANARVKDFHADTGTLTVDGKTGRRDIVLTREGIRFFEEVAAGRRSDDLLLPKDDGGAWDKNHHTRPMRDAVEKAKLPKGTTIYALRHTHASQALLNGMNLKLLAENMGTSVAMIEKHYGKFLAASRRKLIQAGGLKLGLKRSNVRPLRTATN